MPPHGDGDTSREAEAPHTQQKPPEDRSSRYGSDDSRLDAVAEAVAEYAVRKAIQKNRLRAERRMVDPRYLP